MRAGRWVFGVTALGLAAATVTQAQEKEKATGVVALRQAVMQANGAHMVAIKTILTEYPQALDQVAQNAEAIRQDAAITATLFPPGSQQPASSALPTVWSDQAGFKAAGERAAELAAQLADAAKGGDKAAMLAAFGALGGKGCGGCHEIYRKKQS